jgi:hypothetical protein
MGGFQLSLPPHHQSALRPPLTLPYGVADCLLTGEDAYADARLDHVLYVSVLGIQ